MDFTTENERWSEADLCQTAIFLWQGFMDIVLPGGNYRTASKEQQAVYDAQFDGIGQDAGALSMGYIASVVETEFYTRWRDHDFPGVYHYEITETLGSWLAKEGPKLSDFQFGDDRRERATARVVEHYNEMMAGWLVTDKLTTHG